MQWGTKFPMIRRRGFYGHDILHQGRDSGDPGTGSGHQVEYGSVPVSQLQGYPALQGGSQAVFEKALFPGALGVPAGGEEDRN